MQGIRALLSATEDSMLRALECQVLRRARSIVANRWTQDAFARDRHGNAVPFDCEAPLQQRARTFCAYGALVRAAAEDNKAAIDPFAFADRLAVAVTRRADAEQARAALIVINDFGGHGSVLRLFDRALSSADVLA